MDYQLKVNIASKERNIMDKIKITREQQTKLDTLTGHLLVLVASSLFFDECSDKTSEMNTIKDSVDSLIDKVSRELDGLFEIID